MSSDDAGRLGSVIETSPSLLCWRAGEVVSLRGSLSGGWSDLLDSRTRNAAGEQVVSFTSGHVKFR